VATQRKTARKAMPSGRGTARAGSEAAPSFDVELARSAVGSSVGGAQNLVHFLERSQRVHSKALTEWATILDEAAHDVRAADDIPGLLTLQANLASTQVARSAQVWGSLVANWLDAGTLLAEQAQQEATRLSHQVAGESAARPGTATPTEVGSLDWLASLQDAMTQWTGQWAGMVKDVSARAQLAQI
jgi:hypothetical protein